MRLYAFHECPTSCELYAALAFMADRVTRNELNRRLDALLKARKTTPRISRFGLKSASPTPKLTNESLKQNMVLKKKRRKKFFLMILSLGMEKMMALLRGPTMGRIFE